MYGVGNEVMQMRVQMWDLDLPKVVERYEIRRAA